MAAFQPAKEISDPKRFAGRREQLEKGAELLLARDHIFIYGPRGIGKSSLAKQLEIIAGGEVGILADIGSGLADEVFSFVTCYLVRDESVNNINQLLYRLIIDSAALGKFSKLLLEFGEPGSYVLGPSLDAKLVSDFWARAKSIAKTASHGLVIFIDEFELIDHHEGFSSLLKACPPGIIFVITGIATTERELVRDHNSIDRQLTTGKLPVEKMQNSELLTVIDTAERSIANEIVYSRDAKADMVRLVCGQPYLLHLIGRTSLLSAFNGKDKVIELGDLQRSLSDVVLKKADSGLEQRYLRAIGHSTQRETVLRLFAQHCKPTVHTSVVYPVADAEAVSNPSYWVADLQKDAYGQELKKVKEHHYAFSDPLFQAYVAATPRRLTKDRESLTDEQNADSSACVEIIHMSDLHFGQGHYFSDIPHARDGIPQADKIELAGSFELVANTEKFDFDVFALTGDITQRGLSSEFKSAASAVNEIIQKRVTQDSVPEIILVPGNHDVNWALQNADPESKSIGFQPYVTFRNSLVRRQQFAANLEPERMYEVFALELGGLKVAFVSFNSAVLIKEGDGRGYIGASQLNNALHELADRCGDGAWIKVALFHHHIVPVVSIEAQLGQDQLMSDAALVKKRLLESGFSLVLHGHRHHGHEETVGDGTNSLVVVGCGSTGVGVKERGSQPLQFNRIVLRASGRDLLISVMRYTLDTEVGEWKRGTPKTFPLVGRLS
ncbi:metallophosphoesterase [Trinickia fusca]|uniref:metallophosphoesterase n=1 Tax=Trinickia fusca TaxID=2419777 RepID=UPI0016000550|nr:metallophosphoesterase [Trinickia fusca]